MQVTVTLIQRIRNQHVNVYHVPGIWYTTQTAIQAGIDACQDILWEPNIVRWSIEYDGKYISSGEVRI